MNIVLVGMEIVWGILLVLLITGLIAVAWMFVVDYTQRKDAVRQNYPVIGRFRNVFTKAGEFFRQYFFALDREEMPFNRAHRNWIEAATHGADNTIAFGSTKPLNEAGSVIFVSHPFPEIDTGKAHSQPLRIGEGCRHPYDAPSFFNISAMSYGALSFPAISALSRGAAKAGCWLNTGEGGLAPAHLAGGCDLVFQIGTAKYGVRDEEGRLSDEKLRAVAAHERGADVRDQAQPGGEARQGRHPSGHQGECRDRRNPRDSAGKGLDLAEPASGDRECGRSSRHDRADPRGDRQAGGVQDGDLGDRLA